MPSNIAIVVRDTFKDVQYNKTCHPKYMKKLKKYYERGDKMQFTDAFISCICISLTHGEKHPRIENTLEFAAKFAVSLYSFDGNDTNDQMCPFLTQLFDFLLNNHGARDSGVRFRVCHFMNMLLNSMGEDAFIDDELCDRISSKMMDRLLDKSPRVRAQAVFALHRLQDPTDDQCPIIKLFIFHLTKDPQAEVRRAVLANIGKNKKTLQAVLKRTRDISDTVRKLAYQFISKITVRSLTIDQREQVLSDGLKDRSELVSRCVKTVLLPSWLLHFNGEFLSFLKALDAENAVETAIMALETLFKETELKILLEQVPIDPDTKLIPLDKLKSESVLYLRCIVEHLHRENFGEEAERILPELSKFCEYIRDFMTLMGSRQYQTWEKLTHKFVLLQLFEIAKTYDFSDEIGRGNLKQLIIDTLLTEHCSEKLIECVVKNLRDVVPDVDTRLNLIAEVISEIREPMTLVTVPISEEEMQQREMQKARLKLKLNEVGEEQYEAVHSKDYLKAERLKEDMDALRIEIDTLSKSSNSAVNEVREEKKDRATMIKCLNIMCEMMQDESIKTLTPTLRSLMQNMAIPSLNHNDDSVLVLALKAMSICCLLDKDLAKEYIMMFFIQFSMDNENYEIWLMALKSVFDLLLCYGFEHFDIVQEDNADVTHNRSRKNKTVRLYNDTGDSNLTTNIPASVEDGNGNIIKILTGLMDHTNQELRTIATEGMCKLLLHQRISSAALLSRLIIQWHSPVTETDIYLRQCLCGFFKHFVFLVPESQEMLEAAFMPTLRTLANAPDISPLREIDQHRIVQLILSLTKPGMQQASPQSYCPHNNLVFSVMAEALVADSEIDIEVLIKGLKYLEINLEDNIVRENLQEAADKLLETISGTEKRIRKHVIEFKERLKAPVQNDLTANASAALNPEPAVNEEPTQGELGIVENGNEPSSDQQTTDHEEPMTEDVNSGDEAHISDSDEEMEGDRALETPFTMKHPKSNLHRKNPIPMGGMDFEEEASNNGVSRNLPDAAAAQESQDDSCASQEEVISQTPETATRKSTRRKVSEKKKGLPSEQQKKTNARAMRAKQRARVARSSQEELELRSDEGEDSEGYPQKSRAKKGKKLSKVLRVEVLNAEKMVPRVILERLAHKEKAEEKNRKKERKASNKQTRESHNVIPDSDGSGHLELPDVTVRRSSTRLSQNSLEMSDQDSMQLRRSSVERKSTKRLGSGLTSPKKKFITEKPRRKRAERQDSGSLQLNTSSEKSSTSQDSKDSEVETPSRSRNNRSRLALEADLRKEAGSSQEIPQQRITRNRNLKSVSDADHSDQNDAGSRTRSSRTPGSSQKDPGTKSTKKKTGRNVSVTESPSSSQEDPPKKSSRVKNGTRVADATERRNPQRNSAKKKTGAQEDDFVSGTDSDEPQGKGKQNRIQGKRNPQDLRKGLFAGKALNRGRNGNITRIQTRGTRSNDSRSDLDGDSMDENFRDSRLQSVIIPESDSQSDDESAEELTPRRQRVTRNSGGRGTKRKHSLKD